MRCDTGVPPSPNPETTGISGFPGPGSGHGDAMTAVSSGRTRLMVGVLAGALVLALAALAATVAAAVLGGSGEADAELPQVRKAVVVEDLCSLVQPLVPAELGLSPGRSTEDVNGDADGDAGIRRAACTFGSPGDVSLDVRVASYDLLEGDPAGTLDQLVATTCDAVERDFPVAFAADASGCSGLDAESTGVPVGVSASQVGRIRGSNAVVSVLLTDRRLPAQVAAYAAAITYGLVASDLRTAES